MQTHLVPAQYYRSTNSSTQEPTSEYLEHSNFLADINNERSEKNKTYAANIASLAKFVMFVFDEDETVIPKESGWFAQTTNLTTGEFVPLRNRTLYEEDWIGLRALDERGGLVFRTTEGRHMHLTDEVLEGVFREFFAPVKDKGREAEVLQEVMEL